MRKHGKALKRRDENTWKGGQRWADIHTNPELSMQGTRRRLKKKEKRKGEKTEKTKGNHECDTVTDDVKKRDEKPQMEVLGLNLCVSNQDWTQAWGLVARRSYHVWRVSRLGNTCQFGDSGVLRECGSSAPFSPYLALCVSSIRLAPSYNLLLMA